MGERMKSGGELRENTRGERMRLVPPKKRERMNSEGERMVPILAGTLEVVRACAAHAVR